VFRDFNLINPTNLFGLFGVLGTPAHFQLDPKIGWEAAAGFDYRFAHSGWHVSGEFRYGQGGKTSGNAAVSGALPLATLFGAAAAATGPITSITGAEAASVSYKETHWLADGAVGYDIATSGRSNLQLKGGIRIAEFISQQDSSDATNIAINFRNPLPPR
jgi:hypothetical protein